MEEEVMITFWVIALGIVVVFIVGGSITGFATADEEASLEVQKEKVQSAGKIIAFAAGLILVVLGFMMMMFRKKNPY